MAQEVDFPDFYASQYPELCRLGYWLTGDWGQAEDLAQDAFVRVYWRWPLVRRLDRPDQYTRKVLVNRYRSRAVVPAPRGGHAGDPEPERLPRPPRG